MATCVIVVVEHNAQSTSQLDRTLSYGIAVSPRVVILGFFFKKNSWIRRDFLSSAQKVLLCNNRHDYSIRHGNSIA